MKTEKYPEYFKEIKPGVWIDVYDVIFIFDITNPAIAHAVKKLLLSGLRTGGKPVLKDLDESIDAIERGIELEKRGTNP
jgi:hypothetical protein